MMKLFFSNRGIEFIWRDESLFRMNPACQRFGTDYLSCRHADFWLEIRHELAAGERIVHFTFDCAVDADAFDELVVEKGVGIVTGASLRDLRIVSVVDGGIDIVAGLDQIDAATEGDMGIQSDIVEA